MMGYIYYGEMQSYTVGFLGTRKLHVRRGESMFSLAHARILSYDYILKGDLNKNVMQMCSGTACQDHHSVYAQ